MIRAAVIHARAQSQEVREVELPLHATVGDAVREAFPELEPTPTTLGVFGRRVAPGTPLRDGDQVEIYRPLVADPKDSRRQRAAKKAARES
jgi:putative ubiquitin-RnfH superfamily antitoxin RatB of RatAB toxin-antitoxin module